MALSSPPLVDRIISAGVNNIRISLQGLDAETYKKVCGQKIDFDKFIENLTYLYENKKQCTVQMKIADIAIKNVEGGREKLQEIFGKISDGVYVEHIFENFMDVDLDAIDPDLKKQNRLGESISKTPNKVCARQFITVTISCNGSITSACCDPKRSITYGNANVDNLVDVWNGKKRYEFLKFQLEGKRFTRPQCKTCQAPDDVADQRDVLDSYEDEILARMTQT